MVSRALLSAVGALCVPLLGADGLITMAAGKRPAKAAAGGKGFGPKRPSLAEVVASIKTRLPAEAATSFLCACGSGDTYAACCEPYHSGASVVSTAERLVRARYSAFTYRLPAYVVNTTHPLNRDYNADPVQAVQTLDRQGMFDSFEFVNLDIVRAEEASSAEHFVSFTVTLRASRDDGQIAQGQELRVSERSRFLPTSDGASWLYASGEVRALVDGLEDAVLNP